MDNGCIFILSRLMGVHMALLLCGYVRVIYKHVHNLYNKIINFKEGRVVKDKMTSEEFLEFVNSWQWTFAKSYAKKSPHEYINCTAYHSRREDFERAVTFIRENGEAEMYYRKEFTVYKIGGHKYWTMGAPMSVTRILNRSLYGEEDRRYS